MSAAALAEPPRVRFSWPTPPATGEAPAVQEAVAAVQRGDLHRFAVIYEAYYDRVRALLRMLLADAHEAEDVAQDTFVQAMRAIGSYSPREGIPFRAWLYRIARNTAHNRIEKRRRTTVDDPHTLLDKIAARAEPPAPSGLFADEALERALAACPSLQRQVLLLRFVFDLTPAETATVLHRSPEAVRQLQHRALESMRRGLARSEEGAR